MCGILGVALAGTEGRDLSGLRRVLDRLFRRSESRGKEAAGLAVRSESGLRVLKCACPASTMIRSAEYRRLLEQSVPGTGKIARPLCAIGHSRLVTTGGLQSAENNQPVVNAGAAGIHNGIVVNHERLFADNPGLERHGEVDSEVIFALLRGGWAASGDLAGALRGTFAAIEGTASIAAVFADADALVLATNNGSLFTATLPRGGVAFASERRFLAGADCVEQVLAGSALVVDLGTLSRQRFSLAPGATAPPVRPARRPAVPISVVTPPAAAAAGLAARRVGLATLLDGESRSYLEEVKVRFPHESSWQDSLRRCTRCILPETMPFIAFDEDGVCTYCRSYRPLVARGAAALERDLGRHRSPSGAADCVIGVSGGRDSLYALHLLRTELGMHPVAFTYDWGMVTDLARRNIARVCGKLGVEHVVVSADIARKRRFVRDNVSAWLRRPHLGAIPLFMAGDKQYFYFIRRARRELGVPVAVMGENPLERTDFKTGFAGLPPHRDPEHVYTLPWLGKARLAGFFAGQFAANPGYWNASLLDTFWASLCYYALARDYVNLYAYLPWRERDVVSTIREEYGFEGAPDTASTWRIGDGTAAFYNYIFYTVAGFTENDAFRSNQVREGALTRAQALALAAAENVPRYESIFWYLDIIGHGTPLHEVLRIVQAMPKVQPRSRAQSGGPQ